MAKPITPLVAVDALIRYSKDSIILIRRKNPPFKGSLALPGGFVDIGETVEEACIREAFEETNIKVKIVRLIGIFSKPDRDPRGHTISIAFYCKPLSKKEIPKAKDDASALEVVPIKEVPNRTLAFDHKDILDASGILNE